MLFFCSFSCSSLTKFTFYMEQSFKLASSLTCSSVHKGGIMVDRKQLPVWTETIELFVFRAAHKCNVIVPAIVRTVFPTTVTVLFTSTPMVTSGANKNEMGKSCCCSCTEGALCCLSLSPTVIGSADGELEEWVLSLFSRKDLVPCKTPSSSIFLTLINKLGDLFNQWERSCPP